MNEQLLTRLDRSELDDEVETLVFAASLGDDELDQVLGGETVEQPEAPPTLDVDPRRIYLEDISVTGFRGIADNVRLGLRPGPGLTLVVGRNGSGKSSFAEAAEVVFTGTTQRWSDKATKSWEDGWRNVHHQGNRHVAVRLRGDGDDELTTVAVDWAADAELTDRQAWAQRGNDTRTDMDELGLGEAAITWRPFLSYDDIGSLLRSTPSDLHDRLNGLLGLEDWTEVEERLRSRVKRITSVSAAARDGAKALLLRLVELDDERATSALDALKGQLKSWDLPTLKALATGTSDPDPEATRLQQLAALSAPDTTEAARIRSALHLSIERVSALTTSDAAAALSLADLLDAALTHHGSHDDSSICAVCGSPDVITDAWRERARQSVDEQRARAGEVTAAVEEQASLTRRARAMPAAVPDVVLDPPAGIDTAELASVWTDWAALPADASAADVAQHLAVAESVAALVPGVVAAAVAEIEDRRDRWRPVAESIVEWLAAAEAAQAGVEQKKQLENAVKWVREASEQVRDERLEPITEQVRAIWATLRPGSNVSVDDLELGGSKTRRRLEVKVSVSETAAPGMSILSQGELHALSLALFLPRATQEASPFRFVLVDDPVQALDGERVDGLAKVLAEVGADRQVVVFTHDERLPDACRRLGIDARVLEVSRDDDSKVSIRKMQSPADRFIDDARAIALSKDYPSAARARVVPGLCRQAVEAVAVDLSRQRLYRQGKTFAEVEELVGAPTRTVQQLALALVGDAEAVGAMYGVLERRCAKSDSDLVKQLNTGTHRLSEQDPKAVVNDSQRLVESLQGFLAKGGLA